MSKDVCANTATACLPLVGNSEVVRLGRRWRRAWAMLGAGVLAVAIGVGCSDTKSTANSPDATTLDAGVVEVSDGEVSDGDAGAPAVRFVGRLDWSKAEGPLAGFPGIEIFANFEGAEVSVQLGEQLESWMEGTPSEWDVEIDGVAQPKLVSHEGVHDYALASGLAPGAHQVRLYRRSEAQTGMTQFRGFKFGGGHLLAPPAKRPHTIEVLGDSASTGFGIEGVGLGPDCPGPNWAAQWINVHKSYAALIGQQLNADVSHVSYSGKGLVYDVYRPDTELYGLIYDRDNPLDDQSHHDFTTFVPEVVLIMLGGNDFSDGTPGPATPAEFENAYRALLRKVRRAYPRAKVFLLTSATVNDDSPAGNFTRTNILRATTKLADESAQNGDTAVFSFAPTPSVASETTGCNGHGSPALHERLAREILSQIRAKTGW